MRGSRRRTSCPFPSAAEVTRMRTLATMILIVASMAVTSTAAAAPSRPQQLPVGTVNIAGGTYAWFDGAAFLRHYARVPWLQTVLQVVRACPSVKLYGFISLTRGAGVVGRAPSSLSGCLPVQGGGPGAASGCLQAMLTPYPDPYGLSGLRLSRSYVLIAATSDTTCRDLSTQVPGGIWAYTNRAYNGLPAGSLRVIKCQDWDGTRWWDFVAPYSSLPASKRGAVWIPDKYVNTRVSRWKGVPSCS